MTTAQQAISLLGNVFEPQIFGSLQLERLDEEAFILDYQSGVAFTYDCNMRLMSVHIYGVETDGFKVYQDSLPFGLKFGMSFAESNRLLPDPKKHGGGGTSNVDGKPIPIWLRHDADNFSLHLQFGDGLNMITLMHPSVVPRERAN